MNHLVKLSRRLYRALLVLYPVEFRRDYGPLLAAFFEERWAEWLASGRRWPLLRLWWPTIIDLVVSALVERLDGNRRNTMSWRFWLLWILASIAGWLTAGLLTYILVLPIVTLLIGGALVSALHTLILQRITAPVQWWRYALPLNVASWLLPLAFYPGASWSLAAVLLPWQRLSGLVPIIAILALSLFSILLMGIVQGFALRPLLRSPWRWAAVPGATLLVAVAVVAGLSYSLLPLVANLAQSGTFSMALPSSGFISPTVVRELGMVWTGLNLFIVIVAGAGYGVVTGAAFVALTASDGNGKRWVLA